MIRKPISKRALIAKIRKLDPAGQLYMSIVIAALARIPRSRETHSAIMSSVAYELPKRMLKHAIRAESVLVNS